MDKMTKTITYYRREYKISVYEDGTGAYIEWLDDGIYWNSTDVKVLELKQGEQAGKRIAKIYKKQTLSDKAINKLQNVVLELTK